MRNRVAAIVAVAVIVAEPSADSRTPAAAVLGDLTVGQLDVSLAIGFVTATTTMTAAGCDWRLFRFPFPWLDMVLGASRPHRQMRLRSQKKGSRLFFLEGQSLKIAIRLCDRALEWSLYCTRNFAIVFLADAAFSKLRLAVVLVAGLTLT